MFRKQANRQSVYNNAAMCIKVYQDKELWDKQQQCFRQVTYHQYIQQQSSRPALLTVFHNSYPKTVVILWSQRTWNSLQNKNTAWNGTSSISIWRNPSSACGSRARWWMWRCCARTGYHFLLTGSYWPQLAPSLGNFIHKETLEKIFVL